MTSSDCLNGHAQLPSGGGILTVGGLDGSEELGSQGGVIQGLHGFRIQTEALALLKALCI